MDAPVQCSCKEVLPAKNERNCTGSCSGAEWVVDRRSPVLPESLACLGLSDEEKGCLLMQVRALKSRCVPRC